MTAERRFLAGFRETDTSVPGLVIEDDGTIWIVAPDGTRSPLGAAGALFGDGSDGSQVVDADEFYSEPGFLATAPIWTPGAASALGDYVQAIGLRWRCIQAGVTGGTEPDWQGSLAIPGGAVHGPGNQPHYISTGLASYETSLAGDDNDLLFTAVEAGAAGDALTVEYRIPAEDTVDTTAEVDDGHVIVHLAGTVAPDDDAHAAAVLADSPDIYYRENEIGSPPSVADSSGNGHDGTPAGGVIFGDSGPLSDPAARYDGVDDEIDAPAVGSVGTPPYTVERFVYFDAIGGTQQIASPRTALENGWNLVAVDNQLVMVDPDVNGGSGRFSYSTGVLQAGRWTLVAARVKPDSGGQVDLFVDGEEVAYQYHSNDLGAGGGDDTQTAIKLSAGLAGKGAHFAFYPSALSDARLAAHFAAGRAEITSTALDVKAALEASPEAAALMTTTLDEGDGTGTVTTLSQHSLSGGAVDEDADGTVLWLEDTPGAIVTGKLWRDAYFDSLTIEAGRDLEANGFRLFVRRLLTVDGVLCADGSFWAWDAPSDQAYVSLAIAAHAGGRNYAGGAGYDADQPRGLPLGGLGGSGGGAGSFAGGAAGQDAPELDADPDFVSGAEGRIDQIRAWLDPRNPFVALTGHTARIMQAGSNGFFETLRLRPYSGGFSGGGGANNGASYGGGGGGAGAVMLVAALTVAGSGIIRAKGGDGQDALGGTAGGGGGGGGGLVILTVGAIAATVTVSAEGGRGGARSGGGSDGADGLDGRVVLTLA